MAYGNSNNTNSNAERMAKARAAQEESDKKKREEAERAIEERIKKEKEDKKRKSDAAEFNRLEQIKLKRERENKEKNSLRVKLIGLKNFLTSTLRSLGEKKRQAQLLKQKESQLTFAQENAARAIQGIEMKIQQEATMQQKMVGDEQHKKTFLEEKKRSHAQVLAQAERIKGEIRAIEQQLDQKKRQLKSMEMTEAGDKDEKVAASQVESVHRQAEMTKQSIERLEKEKARAEAAKVATAKELELLKKNEEDMKEQVSHLEENEHQYEKEIADLERKVR